MAKANRKYKDRLFKFIFGNPSHKEWTLMLYNAVNGTQYQNAEDIELTTIEDAIYMGMKNDVSFIILNVNDNSIDTAIIYVLDHFIHHVFGAGDICTYIYSVYMVSRW